METLRSIFKPQAVQISGLLDAIRANTVDDTLARFMPHADWLALAPFLEPEEVSKGRILTAQGAYDRTVYFIEAGTVRIHFGDRSGEFQIATLGPGSAVGEGAFFSELQRSATVQAVTACRVWGLTPAKFAQLRTTLPSVALALAMALGATISMRMLDVTRRIAVT